MFCDFDTIDAWSGYKNSYFCITIIVSPYSDLNMLLPVTEYDLYVPTIHIW